MLFYGRWSNKFLKLRRKRYCTCCSDTKWAKICVLLAKSVLCNFMCRLTVFVYNIGTRSLSFFVSIGYVKVHCSEPWPQYARVLPRQHVRAALCQTNNSLQAIGNNGFQRAALALSCCMWRALYAFLLTVSRFPRDAWNSSKCLFLQEPGQIWWEHRQFSWQC